MQEREPRTKLIMKKRTALDEGIAQPSGSLVVGCFEIRWNQWQPLVKVHNDASNHGNAKRVNQALLRFADYVPESGNR